MAGGNVDTLRYVPTKAGWHQIVVSRRTAAGAGDVGYGLAWVRDQRVLAARVGLPARRALYGPWPNPIRESAGFAIELPQAEHVTIGLFDLSGRLCMTLVDREISAGRTELTWSPSSGASTQLAPGLYWLRWSGRSREFQKRVVLIR